MSLLLTPHQDTDTALFIDLFTMGLRFDLKAIAAFSLLFALLPALLISLCNRWQLFNSWVKYSLLATLLLSAFVSFVDIGFYFYFGSQINGLAFGIVEDGTYAVMVSIFSDWRLVLLSTLAGATLYAVGWLYLKSTKVKSLSRGTQPRWITFGATFLLFVICALLARGSFDKFPLSRKTAFIGDDALLNSMTMNGPFHLYYSIKDRDEDNFSQLNTAHLLRGAKLETRAQLERAAGYGAEAKLRPNSSVKASNFTPPNVVFVLMEGWSSHIAIEHSAKNQVLGRFAQHANSDYFFPRFFSNKYGTNPSIESLLLNSPVGPVSQSSASLHAFQNSNLRPFKAQHYSTLFLSGGNISWRKHGQFWPRQGFDRYIARATIEQHFDIKADNPWGVYDEYVFKYLEKELAEKPADQPLFSFVLTTNNHGPVKLPTAYKAPPLAPEQYGFSSSDSHKREALTGFHYQSDSLGQFMDWLKQSDFADNTIVVATGDHILKGFANYTAPAKTFDRYAVPVYFYIPQKYDQLQNTAGNTVGSHADIFPTLFELALNNQQYLNFGQPLMHKTPSTAFGWIDQGGYVFDQGISDNAKRLLPWQTSGAYLSDTQRPLNQQQLELITQQKYREILRKFVLVDDFKKH
ncbi:MAG: LTA synthase family protein [Pseudomonadales bacterium]